MNKIFAAVLLSLSLFIVISSAPSIFGLLTDTLTISSSGNVMVVDGGGDGGSPPPTVDLKVCWDSECTDEVTTIDWGVMYPGSMVNVTIYLKNEGNTPLAVSLNTSDWNPASATDYISLSWDHSGEVLAVGEVVQVTLTLSVSSSISGISSFSVNLIIIATET